MKGVVFAEFLDHVEARHGAVFLESVLDGLHLESGAAYTTTGTYDWRELAAIATAYAAATAVPLAAVLRTFGHRLFSTLARGFPELVRDYRSAFQLLGSVEDVIHPCVQRLYPDAELPQFQAVVDGDTMRLEYRSKRPLADLALGLIEGCLQHFGEMRFVIVVPSEVGATFHLHARREVPCSTK